MGPSQLVVMARMSKLSKTRARTFDLEFWQAQNSAARSVAVLRRRHG
jgi:hypothetical protein